MSCSCGKRRPRPSPGQNTQKPAPTGQSGTGQTQQGGRKQSFALQTRSGKVQTFGSELEANAANARIGFTGTVRAT